MNLIPDKDKNLDENDIILHGDYYKNKSIGFDIPSQKKLYNYLETISNP